MLDPSRIQQLPQALLQNQAQGRVTSWPWWFAVGDYFLPQVTWGIFLLSHFKDPYTPMGFWTLLNWNQKKICLFKGLKMLIHPPKIVLKNICVKQEMQLMKCPIYKNPWILCKFWLRKTDASRVFCGWSPVSAAWMTLQSLQPGVSRSGPCKSLRRRDGFGVEMGDFWPFSNRIHQSILWWIFQPTRIDYQTLHTQNPKSDRKSFSQLLLEGFQDSFFGEMGYLMHQRHHPLPSEGVRFRKEHHLWISMFGAFRCWCSRQGLTKSRAKVCFRISFPDFAFTVVVCRR